MRTRSTTCLALAAAGLVGGAVLVARHDDHPVRDRAPASATLDLIDPSRPSAFDPTATSAAPEQLRPPAPTPEDAVRGLLDALVIGDAEQSYSLLGGADRAAFGPLAAWAANVTGLPHYLGYTLTGSDGNVVRTEVTIEPRLDEVVGYVPGRAAVAWSTVAEDGGYRVSFTDSTTEPVLPTDDAATATAQAWVADRQQCRSGQTYSGNLLGQPIFADTLCRLGGVFQAGPASGLESFRDPSLLLNAFGADAATFVRVVPVAGPTPFQIALAPLGDAWEVVGLMEV